MILQFRIIICVFFIVIIILFIHFNIRLNTKYSNTTTTNIQCRQPTMNNPYANYLLNDKSNLSACISKDYDNIKNDYNNFNVYYNSKNISINSLLKINRTFYTTAITSHPNDLNKYIEFIYN